MRFVEKSFLLLLFLQVNVLLRADLEGRAVEKHAKMLIWSLSTSLGILKVENAIASVLPKIPSSFLKKSIGRGLNGTYWLALTSCYGHFVGAFSAFEQGKYYGDVRKAFSGDFNLSHDNVSNTKVAHPFNFLGASVVQGKRFYDWMTD
jgi:hypothetical protein